MAALIGVFILALSSCGGSGGSAGGIFVGGPGDGIDDNPDGNITKTDPTTSLKITVNQINDISFDYEITIEKILTLTADPSFTNYKWVFDGKVISAYDNSDTAEINLDGYDSGDYSLFITAEKNGILFSTDSIVSF